MKEKDILRLALRVPCATQPRRATIKLTLTGHKPRGLLRSSTKCLPKTPVLSVLLGCGRRVKRGTSTLCRHTSASWYPEKLCRVVRCVTHQISRESAFQEGTYQTRIYVSRALPSWVWRSHQRTCIDGVCHLMFVVQVLLFQSVQRAKRIG